MSRNGLQTSHELAQVFRVNQTTAARWMREAQVRPLDEVLPGPAMILFDLMAGGLETPDLAATRRIAAVHARPGEFGLIEDEAKWRRELSTSARGGMTLRLPTGHSFVVHSGWLRERIERLDRLVAEAEDHAVRQKASTLAGRYRDDLARLGQLPR
jgi:hypothetical protein